MERRDAGRIGGLATKARYGASHFHQLGKLGGRPPVKIIPPPGTPREIIIKRGMPSAGYRTLLHLWESHHLNTN